MPTQRDLTQIRLQAARATSALKTAVDAMEKIVEITGRNDARELRKRPSLRRRSRGSSGATQQEKKR